ncbi:MAG TPA: GNVR domain-containing protein [Polyangia bacterium]|jgi:uncharacterized protein involved in exopolysaccharide biosynthesis
MPTPPRPDAAALSNEQKVARYVTLAKRALHHWPLAGLIFCLAIAVAVGIALTSTRYYRSEALIYYKEVMSNQGVTGQESSGTQRDLVHKLHQLLWSRTRLLKIIKQYDLYPDQRKARTEEEVVEVMRNAVEVREKGGDTFWVSYEYRDPKITQQVTQRLADTFIEETAKEAVDRSRLTLEFVQTESAKAKAELDRSTSELARFYEQHPELVPASGADPRAPGAAVAAITKAAAKAKRPRYVIKGASPELRALLAEKGRLEAQLSLQSQPRQGGGEREQELADARRQLATLRARFSDDYPDVVSAKARLARLQGMANAERRLGGSDPESVRLRGEIGRLDAEIARLTPKAKKIDDGGDKAPDKGKGAPEVDTTERLETEYSRLVQAYEIAKARSAALSDRQLQAGVKATMEARQEQATFRIVDPAYLPEKVVRPSRRKIVMLGAVLGLMMGLAAVGARVLLDPRIYGEDDLLGLNLPLLAQVPREQRRAKA